MNPDTTYYTSAPFHYQPDPYTPAWDVSTYDHTYAGSISVTSATLRSDNTVYAQLTLDVGPEKVAEMAHRLGVTTQLDVVPAMGLGADAISPLDEASAYATLAAGGIYSKPMAIRKVKLANGKVDTDAGWGNPERKRVISDGVAYEVTRILEENVLEGTGTGAYFGRPAAGKTGTTDNHADGWFSGYVPQLEATVWVGYPQGEIPMENVHGIAVAGGTFPATIWQLLHGGGDGEHARARLAAADRLRSTWKPFTQGQYGSSLGYSGDYYSPPASVTPQTTTTAPATARRRPAGGSAPCRSAPTAAPAADRAARASAGPPPPPPPP